MFGDKKKPYGNIQKILIKYANSNNILIDNQDTIRKYNFKRRSYSELQ